MQNQKSVQNQGKLDTCRKRSRVKVAVLTFLGCLMITSALHPADRIYPLKIAATKRYLVDQNNAPFLVQGDSAWSLIVAVSDDGVEQYLKNRRQKGFNAIIVNLLEHKFCPHPPRNLAGEGPFTRPGDFSTPNEKYFAHVDWVIRKAAENDMVVVLYPFTLGYMGTDEGWVEETLANGPEKCLNFGRYLGRRYKDFDNIMWILAGDRHPEGPILEDIDLLALGIREYDRRHLISAHCEPEHSGVDGFSGGGWLDFNTTYTYGIVHIKLLQDYNRTPAMPFLLVESSYEGEQNASEVQIRRQAYWAVLCGGFGHFFGNSPLWHFDGPGIFPSNITWQQAMDLPGSTAMQLWAQLFHSRSWYDLIPDQKHEVVTSGLGEFKGLDYLAAARTSDGSTVIAYMPTSRAISVDMSKITGSQVKAWWFNPRNGGAAAAGIFPASGTHEFTPPGEGDWVLVLDDATRQLPAPGAAR
jgi:hypothetical protein